MHHLLLVQLFCVSFCCKQVNTYCGEENNDKFKIRTGVNQVEDYPWMGILYYPATNKRKYTTAVVLISREIVLAAANEIDSLPKTNFRSRSRVILGQQCNGTGFRVKDYVYHSDYKKTTFSALAMVQIDTNYYNGALQAICAPPAELINPSIYAMVLSDNCADLSLSIYRMRYVSTKECKAHYRKSGLDVDTMWPTIPVCARSYTGGHCIWRSGSILAVKTQGKWRLLGFHVYGPGCESPARFIDYGMYHKWVKKSIGRIGTPSISTIGPNIAVLRRSFLNIQRFGPCDVEEQKKRIYDDETTINHLAGRVKYNITLYADIEYYCVVFRADYIDGTKTVVDRPLVRIRHWCTLSNLTCSAFQTMEVDLYVEILFYHRISFGIQAFGKQSKYIDPKLAMLFTNKVLGEWPRNFSTVESTQWFRSPASSSGWWPGQIDWF